MSEAEVGPRLGQLVLVWVPLLLKLLLLLSLPPTAEGLCPGHRRAACPAAQKVKVGLKILNQAILIWRAKLENRVLVRM